MSLRRTVFGSLTTVGVALAFTGATVFACIAPATLNLSSAAGRPGDVITVEGSGYPMPPQVTTGVQVRWGSTNGPVLAEVAPDANGAFSTAFTVPDAAPGHYLVAAVLLDEHGENVPGTPGRALFEIRNPAAAAVTAPLAAPNTPATAEPAGSWR